MKTKALISFAVTVKLILFSHMQIVGFLMTQLICVAITLVLIALVPDHYFTKNPVFVQQTNIQVNGDASLLIRETPGKQPQIVKKTSFS